MLSSSKAQQATTPSFLLRHGRTFNGRPAWSRAHFTWLSEQRFEHPAHQIVCQDYINAILDGQQRRKELEKMLVDLIPTWSMQPVVHALCIMRGINIVAASLPPAISDAFQRRPRLGAYFGLVPAEHSSGESVNRMGITKRGNTEVRRVLAQSAWTYRFPARVTADFEKSNYDADKKVRELAWRAQVRLCGRYRRLSAKGKRAQVVCIAIARELTCFIWRWGTWSRRAASDAPNSIENYDLAGTARSRAQLGQRLLELWVDQA
jgi:transposase